MSLAPPGMILAHLDSDADPLRAVLTAIETRRKLAASLPPKEKGYELTQAALWETAIGGAVFRNATILRNRELHERCVAAVRAWLVKVS